MPDYEKLVLTEPEQRVFSKFKHVNSTELTEPEYNILQSRGLIDREQLRNPIELTYTVRLSRSGQELKAYQKLCRKRQFKDDIRYWITTLIALIALVISVVSLYG